MTISIRFSGNPCESQRAARLLQEEATTVRGVNRIEITELYDSSMYVKICSDKDLPSEIVRRVRGVIGSCNNVHLDLFKINA